MNIKSNKNHSKDYLISDFFGYSSSGVGDTCLNYDQVMCLNWGEFCIYCTRRFPTETSSTDIYYVTKSEQIEEDGLFTNIKTDESEYICRYVQEVQVPKVIRLKNFGYFIFIEFLFIASNLIVSELFQLMILTYMVG